MIRRLLLPTIPFWLVACGGPDDRQVQAMEESLALQEEMLAIAERVVDDASAKKAVQELEGFSRRATDFANRWASLEAPTEEEQAELLERFGDRMAALQRRAWELGTRLADHPEVANAMARAVAGVRRVVAGAR